MTEAITWWALIELLGLMALPACVALFARLPDRGYNFSKVIGLLVLSYIAWIGASAHLVPSKQWTLIAIFAVLGAASLALALHRRAELRELLSERWGYVLASEALFTAVFAVALLVRTDIVDVLPGERPTDMAILNAIVRADTFPPEDPWLAGHDVNYYYFGHVLVASLAELSAVPTRLAFNLGLGLIYALSASAAFGVVFNLVATRARAVVATGVALLGSVLLLVMSNVVGLFELMAVHGVGSGGFIDALDVAGLDGTRESSEWYPTEWLWPGRSIAFTDGTVSQQFPFAKFILGELHSENLAIPLVLLLMGAALLVWRSPYVRPSLSMESAALYGLPALTLGALAASQIWYVPALLLLLIGAFAARRYLEDGLAWALARRTAAFAAIVAGLSVVLYAPFYGASFGAFNGFALADDTAVTQPHHLAYMWLPLGWLALALVALGLRRTRPTRAAIAAAAAVPLAVVAFWLAWLLIDRGAGALVDALVDRAENGSWLTVAALAAALAATLLALFARMSRARKGESDVVSLPTGVSGAVPVGPAERRSGEQGDELPLVAGLSALALLLLLGVQFFWVDDNARPGFNTLIKANFLAWFFLSVSGAYAAYLILRGLRRGALEIQARRLALVAVGGALLAAGMLYPLTSTLYLTSLFDEERHLDLLSTLERNHPAEYEAILWLDENVEGTPVVLEATAAVSYTDYAQVSSYTGLPTVLGWPPHEFHWRGSWEPQNGRLETVQRIYETDSASEAAALMTPYRVQYVYAGRLEREYPNANIEKFGEFMDVVFENETVTIYRVRDGAVVSSR